VGRKEVTAVFKSEAAAGLSRDELDAYWMPFTSNREFKDNPRMVVGADGHYFVDGRGRKIFDSLSGLWCCSLGHGRSEIAQAINSQLQKLDYAPGFQIGHPLAFLLAEKLASLAPEGMNHVFFTNSGSEAVDTTLKLARAYWRQKGQATKTKLIGRAKGYHGVNYGGTSVGGIAGNRRMFGQLADIDHLPHTLLAANRFSRGQPEHGAELANVLDDLVNLHDASNIAAVIVEPLSGSAGVLPPPTGYLERLRALCDKHDILLIFDEVITGFGRVGGNFAADVFGVKPDIIAAAKTLTNGVVPMGAVIARDIIHDTLMETGGPRHAIEFPHGYTYSGHPLACAAALASLDILEREKLAERVVELASHFESVLHGLKGLKYVSDIRNFGLAGAIQIEEEPRAPGRRPWEIALKCWDAGYYVRFGGDTLQFGPPFTSEKAELDSLMNVVSDAITSIS
jgi:beta-alanine--pyruvate transaminase